MERKGDSQIRHLSGWSLAKCNAKTLPTSLLGLSRRGLNYQKSLLGLLCRRESSLRISSGPKPISCIKRASNSETAGRKWPHLRVRLRRPHNARSRGIVTEERASHVMNLSLASSFFDRFIIGDSETFNPMVRSVKSHSFRRLTSGSGGQDSVSKSRITAASPASKIAWVCRSRSCIIRALNRQAL